MSGSVSAALAPNTELFTGTERRCINTKPSRSISSISTRKMEDCSEDDLGRNTSPVPYFPFSGTGMPCSKINSCGICNMMPAPSPVLLSAPSAPRCFRFSNTFSAESTNSCDLFPWMSTIMPTPQASCSFAASYNPNVRCEPVALSLLSSLIKLLLFIGVCFLLSSYYY